ncbi:MAG: hypothetical protein HDQ88_00905 [Clostridia bacterium]|nr:hypothetical protein [Clostridia bacterium]
MGIVTVGVFAIIGVVIVREAMKRNCVSIIDCFGIKQYEMDIDDLIRLGVIEDV